MSANKPIESCSVAMHLELPVLSSVVWEYLEQNAAWHPFVVDAGQRRGHRYYRLVNGEELIHEHYPLPDGQLGYHYKLRSLHPLRHYEAWVYINDQTGGRCRVTWRSTFEAPPEKVEEAVKLVKFVYQTGFDTLLNKFAKPGSIALEAPKRKG